jgi:hypothetical protein
LQKNGLLFVGAVGVSGTRGAGLAAHQARDDRSLSGAAPVRFDQALLDAVEAAAADAHVQAQVAPLGILPS